MVRYVISGIYSAAADSFAANPIEYRFWAKPRLALNILLLRAVGGLLGRGSSF